MTADPDGGAPLLLLGADGFGRDIFSRLLYAARVTLALALVATLGATLLGTLLGGAGRLRGGRLDALLSRCSEFVLVLPAIYVVLALRAVLPLVVPPADGLRRAGRASSRCSAGRSSRAACAPSSRRARARVRAGRARAGRRRRRACSPAPAAGGARLPGVAGHAAAAGVHPGRGHAVVRRPRLSRHACPPGARCCRTPRTSRCSATRRGRWRRPRRFSSWSLGVNLLLQGRGRAPVQYGSRP